MGNLEEGLSWLDQAGADIKTSGDCLKHGNYYASAFFAQQSAEKGDINEGSDVDIMAIAVAYVTPQTAAMDLVAIVDDNELCVKEKDILILYL